jgi:hypothetical protein
MEGIGNRRRMIPRKHDKWVAGYREARTNRDYDNIGTNVYSSTSQQGQGINWGQGQVETRVAGHQGKLALRKHGWQGKADNWGNWYQV